MSESPAETINTLTRLALPYGKELDLFEVSYENGFKVLRLRIKEGKRFTMLDLDGETATAFGALLSDWAGRNRGEDKA